MSYNSDIPGETVEQLLKKVMSGEVVTENTSNVVSDGDVKPVSGGAVVNYIRDVVNTSTSDMYIFAATLQNESLVDSAPDKSSIAAAIRKLAGSVNHNRLNTTPIYLRVLDTDTNSDLMALASEKIYDYDTETLTTKFEIITSTNEGLNYIHTFEITAPYKASATGDDVSISYHHDYTLEYNFFVYLSQQNSISGTVGIPQANAASIISELYAKYKSTGSFFNKVKLYLRASTASYNNDGSMTSGNCWRVLASRQYIKDGNFYVMFDLTTDFFEGEMSRNYITISAPFKANVTASEVTFDTFFDYGTLYKDDEHSPIDFINKGATRPVTSNAVALMRDEMEHLSATLLSVDPGDTLDFQADLENDADMWLKIFNRARSNKVIDVHLRLHKPVGNSPFYNGNNEVDVLVDSYKNEGSTIYLYANVPFANGQEKKLTVEIFSDYTRVLSVNCTLDSIGHLMTTEDDSNINQLKATVEKLSTGYIFGVGLNADGSLNYSGTYFARIKNTLFKTYSVAGLNSDDVSLKISLDNYSSKTVSASYIQRTIVGASLIVKFDCPMDWTGKSDILRVTIQGMNISEDMADGDVFVDYEYVSVVNPDKIQRLKTTKPNVDIFMSGIEAATDRKFSISITHPLQEIFPDGRFVLMRRGGNRVRSTKRNSAYKGWVVAFPPQVPYQGYDGMFTSLPKNKQCPYLLNSEYKGNTAPYDLLIDLLRYTAWFKQKNNNVTQPFWDFESEYETEELMLNLSDNNIGYLGFNLGIEGMDEMTLNGHRSTTIGIAFAVPNPAWNGTVGKRKDFEQAIDGSGNPRYFFSAPRQLCFSLRGLKRLYHLGTTTDAEVGYPSLRVMD